MKANEYNQNRPRQKCPNCGKEITSACFNRHLKACVDPNSKLNQKINKDVYVVNHDGLNCVYCNKECKNKNSLVQHEIRCKLNPNRYAYDQFSKYIKEFRKGKTKENCPEIQKQCETIANKYKEGYVNPLLGKTIHIDYLYLDHNQNEINKWLNYLKSTSIEIPYYEAIDYGDSEHKNKYRILKQEYYKVNSSIKLIFEHTYLMSFYVELLPNNVVHHIDFNGRNNTIFNLMVFKSRADHKRFHNSKYAKLSYDELTHMFTTTIDKNLY